METNGEWESPEMGDDEAGCEWKLKYDPENLIIDFSDVDECAVCGKEYDFYGGEHLLPQHRCHCEAGLWRNEETGKKCLVPEI